MFGHRAITIKPREVGRSGAYDKLIYYNKAGEGGHYAAWKQPKRFSEELRAGFRSLR